MSDVVKPDIVKQTWYGTYVTETGRLLRVFITDAKRVTHAISVNQVSVCDEDITRFGKALEVLTLEMELMLAHKFPAEVDISEEDMLKHYGMKIDKGGKK